MMAERLKIPVLILAVLITAIGIFTVLDSTWSDTDGKATADDSCRTVFGAENPSGKCGANLNWELSANTLTITGTGEMYTWSSASNVPWNAYVTQINTVTIDEGAEGIGPYAFAGCTSLTSLPMANSITYIGKDAFNGCTGITSITIPYRSNPDWIAADAFNGCTNLTTLNIDVNAFVRYTSFSNCGAISTVNFTDSTGTGQMPNLSNDSTSSRYSGNTVWNNVSGVAVTIPSGITTVGAYYFNGGHIGSAVIPLSVTSLGTGAFNGCSSMKSLTIPAAINASGMFADCSGLTTVQLTGSGSTYDYDSDSYDDTPWYISRNKLTKITLDSTITEIGAHIFRGCYPKLSLTIEDQITRVGDYAYADNKYTSVYIPAGAVDVSPQAFGGCTSLSSFSVADGNPNFSAVDGFLCNKGGTELIMCPSGVSGTFTVPDSITLMRAYSVYYCPLMTGFAIGSTTELADYAVSDCSALTTLYVPADRTLLYPGFACDTITTVYVTGSGAMKGYSTDPTDDDYYQNTPWYKSRDVLTSVIVSESATSIGSHAFDGCSKLTHLTIPGSMGLTADTFANCKELSELEFVGSGDMFDYSADESSAYYYKNVPWYFTRSATISVKLSDSATSIGDNTFRRSATLYSIEFPSSITSIGDHAFDMCTSLTELDFPASITKFGEGAFYGSWEVHKMVFEGRLPTDVGKDCFKFNYRSGSETCIVISEDEDDRLPDESVDSGVMTYYSPATYQAYLDDLDRIASLKDMQKILLIAVPAALAVIAVIGIIISERRVV